MSKRSVLNNLNPLHKMVTPTYFCRLGLSSSLLCKEANDATQIVGKMVLLLMDTNLWVKIEERTYMTPLG